MRWPKVSPASKLPFNLRFRLLSGPLSDPVPMKPNLVMSDYFYDLPHDRIAERPLPERDAAKLLLADVSGGAIHHRTVRELSEILPAKSLLVVNRSRVVAARLLFTKPTGGVVEILLLRPVAPSADPAVVLASQDSSDWECLVGGKNVTVGMTLQHQSYDLTATVLARSGTEGSVRLEWSSSASLSAVLDRCGHVPLPPYIKRADDAEDQHRYQTIFARDEGSVAAPTAGLHFTPAVIEALAAKGVRRAEVTLHVGLGTFQPVEATTAAEHTMHAERIEVDRQELQIILDHLEQDVPFITVVGTTSLRTLESLYWFGCGLLDGNNPTHMMIHQWSAFDGTPHARRDALAAVAAWMDGRGLQRIWGETQLMLAPGAHLGVVDALMTNFHQPGNTLLLLVAAVAGDPFWRQIYTSALANDYRFLSYGDSSLIIRQDAQRPDQPEADESPAGR